MNSDSVDAFFKSNSGLNFSKVLLLIKRLYFKKVLTLIFMSNFGKVDISNLKSVVNLQLNITCLDLKLHLKLSKKMMKRHPVPIIIGMIQDLDH